MPGSFARPLAPPCPGGRDVLSPAAALTLALMSQDATTVTVARLTRTLAPMPTRGAARPPAKTVRPRTAVRRVTRER
jgi:hypothetical protein